MKVCAVLLACVLCLAAALPSEPANDAAPASAAPVAPASNAVESVKDAEPVFEEVDDVAPEDEEESAAKLDHALAQVESTVSYSGVTELEVQIGQVSISHGETAIPTSIENPMILLGAVRESAGSVQSPALVPRARFADGVFYVSLAMSPCANTNGIPDEKVDFMIVKRNDGSTYKVTKEDGSVVYVAAFHTTTGVVGQTSLGYKKNFPNGFPKSSPHNAPRCMATIQTVNQPGYVQANTHWKSRTQAYVRLVGTRDNDLRINFDTGAVVKGSSRVVETVGVFCVSITGVNQEVTIPTTIGPLRARLLASSYSLGILNVAATPEERMVLGGAMKGRQPYHFRVFPDNNGIRHFFLQEDKCHGIQKIAHLDESVLLLSATEAAPTE